MRRRGLGVAPCVAFVLAASAAPAPAATPQLVLQWGSEGTGAGQFGNGRPPLFPSQRDDPAGIAVDPQGNVVVADTSNSRIERFGPTGAFLGAFGRFGTTHGVNRTTALGRLNQPNGVAVDPAGNIWEAEYANDRIEKLSPAGRALLAVGRFGSGRTDLVRPSGMAAAADGSVLIVDRGNARVKRFTTRGAFAGAFGSFGDSSPGRMRLPVAVAVAPSGMIYLVDAVARRVQIFSTFGAPLGSFGSFGTGPGQFTRPLGIAVDAAGVVSVTDNFNVSPPNASAKTRGGRVERFTADGAFVDSYGAGALLSPTYVAIDRGTGSIYVSDYRRVVKFA
jgi:DNA-binding beta-propeller fold protein YncE